MAEKIQLRKFVNETGGSINIPVLAKSSPLVGAVDHWLKVEDGKTFSVEVQDGEPINPSLRVLVGHGIRLASEKQ